MAKKSLFQTIKDLFKGGGSSKSNSPNSSVKKAAKVSNYGGGGYSSSYRSGTYATRRADDEKEKQRKRIAEQNAKTTASLAEIAKMSQRTDSLSSGKKATPPSPKVFAESGVDRAIKKIGEKSNNGMTARYVSLTKNNLDTLKKNKQKKREEFNKATGYKYDVKTNGLKARQEQKSQAYDPNVARHAVEVNPILESAARGFTSGVTLGASDLLAAKGTKGQARKEEEYYQANKNKGAERVGALAGGLASYGGTAGAFENLGQQAVGRAAATEVGKKLGAEKLAQVMAGEGAKAGLARTLVGGAVQDSTLGLFNNAMDTAQRDDLETPGDYAKAIGKGQLGYYAMGVAGGTLAHGLPVAGRALGNWWGKFADKSRRLYAVPNIGEEGRRVVMNSGNARNLQSIQREAGMMPKRLGRKAEAPIPTPSMHEGVRAATENLDNLARYNELTAERKQIMDSIFAKNENADPNALRRLQEINAELKSIEEATPEVKVRPKEKITEESVKKPSDTAKTEEKITEEPVKNPTETAATEEKITEDNVKKETARKPTKNEQKRAELQAERDELAEQYRIARESGAAKRELQQMADDMAELDAMLKDLDGKIKKADARRTAKQTKASSTVETPKTEAPRTEEPTTELAPGTERAEAGENAGVGERTEFRRSEEQTEREQARNRRAEGNRERATQESFDNDFAEFERKITENQAKISELKGRLRAAVSEEEKTALKQQIDSLNREVKSAYNRASLRYHPDRGGSNEWMGKFNTAYDQFKRGSYYSSRGFSGASSSTRSNANAGNRTYERYRRASSSNGNGGSTPPPGKGATANGNDGFKKPKGKAKKGYARTVDSVEEAVYKRAEAESFAQKASKVVDDARMRVADSHAPFEDVARKYAKTNPERMQNMYGSIDAHRRSDGYANRSIGEKQINYMGQAYKDSKSLKDIYKGMDAKTENAFDAYLLLKHSPDRLREGTPIFDNVFAKNVAGRLDDERVIQSEIERLLREHPEFEAKAEEIYRYTQNELKNLVDAGLVSKETAAKWATDHPFYVPTHRAGFNGLATNVHGSTIGASGHTPIL